MDHTTIRDARPFIKAEHETSIKDCIGCPGCKGTCAALREAMLVPSLIVRRGEA